LAYSKKERRFKMWDSEQAGIAAGWTLEFRLLKTAAN
jgi:hypothetical protein